MGIRSTLKRLVRRKKTDRPEGSDGVYSPTAGTPARGSARTLSVITTVQPPERLVSFTLPPDAAPVSPVTPTQPTASDAATLSLSGEFEPWTRAYTILQSREPELMDDYKKHLASLHDGATDANLSSSRSVELIVKHLLEDREKKQWRLSLMGKEIKIREQSEKLAKFLLWTDPIVKNALSAQPHAALAWCGVSLLLPLLTSGTTNNESMLKGFYLIGNIQLYWEICERTYLRPSHGYRYQDLMEPLSKLYSHIVEYQARVICHLSKAQLSRAWQNLAGWNDWNGKLAEIDDINTHCIRCIQPLEAEEIRKNRDNQLQEMQKSREILDEIWRILETGREQIQMNYEDQKERNLLQDLASDYKDYKDFNPPRVPGTCEWFFMDDRFCDWRDSSTSSLLWISAGPGCGKSVLSRALIDERRLTTKVTTSTICYFFFKDGDERRMHASNALCAILHQLFTHNPGSSLIRHALPSHKNYGKNLVQNFSELWQILLDCTNSLDTAEIVCVIDALDECNANSRRQLIEKLKVFYCQPSGLSQPLSKLKFLITSRPYDDLEISFNTFATTATYLHFDGDEKAALISNEINLVIDARLGEIANNFKKGDRERISTKLKSMEHRTYLWLHLTFEIIQESPSEFSRLSDMEALLSNLPSKVSEAYEKILERSGNPTYTETLLQIVLAAARPLTLDEANIALTLALQKQNFVSYPVLESSLWPRKSFESTVKNLCGLFISVYDSKISFIHQTAREFLIHSQREGKWQGRLNTSTSHRKMSLVCLLYLSYIDEQSAAEEIKAKFPLAQYSARYWMDHARPAETEQDVQKSILSFFLQQEQTYRAWGRLFDPDAPEDETVPGHMEMATPLYYATLANLQNTVRLLLGEGADVNAQGGRYSNALQAASSQGHLEIVQLLLKEGADVNAQGGYYSTALCAASSQGHLEIVQLLLKEGADINMQARFYSNALQAASSEGFLEIMQLLLTEGADITAQGGGYSDALYTASLQGHLEIVQLLLNEGADINAQGGRYSNALQAASSQGHLEIVQLLLKEGADVNAQGGYYSTALQAASSEGHLEIVQ